MPAESYDYPRRATVRHSLHGRVSMIPARLTGYGEAWEGDRCVLWAEGIVQQAAMFGENLHLVRRIEADVGGNEIRIRDRVVNHGFAPHAAHVLLPRQRRLSAARRGRAASRAGPRGAVGRRTPAAYRGAGRRLPDDDAGRAQGFREQVWEHDLARGRGGG